MTLDRIAEAVWAAPFPHSLGGLQLGTRMTVVRLSDGSLFVHSPIALDEALKRAIDALGPVGHIVAPNLYHHMYVGDFAAAYPEAKTYAAPGLSEKRSDLRFDEALGSKAGRPWGDELSETALEGFALGETVFFHAPSRTLISSDLIQNFDTSKHWPTRLYLRAAGIHRKTGVSRLIRLLLRDKTEGRRTVDRVLDWKPERIILAHGSPILSNGEEALRDAYRWLKA